MIILVCMLNMLAAEAGTIIGVALEKGRGVLWTVPTTSIWAVPHTGYCRRKRLLPGF
jgi:hypothetical protein